MISACKNKKELQLPPNSIIDKDATAIFQFFQIRNSDLNRGHHGSIPTIQQRGSWSILPRFTLFREMIRRFLTCLKKQVTNADGNPPIFKGR
jgi:hypothetical protein